MLEIITNGALDNRLKDYKLLDKKDLFFSDKTQKQVERLTQLLSEKQYQRIHKTLRKKGMPTGFCCLFYGAPGTGKTECVQQLAIATGRNLMQVDIASLRDKYVGEKNISRKQIINSIFTGLDTLDYQQIEEDCQAEKLSRTNGRRIGF